jgi:hypothetical protein
VIKRVYYWVVVLLLLLTGCQSQAVDQTLKTLQASQKIIPNTGVIDSTLNPVQILTPDPAQISITSIQTDKSSTQNAILVSWKAAGEFPMGFKVVFSETNKNPTFPVDPFIQADMVTTLQARVNLEPGRTYHFRVCKYIGSDCINYSQVVTFQNPEIILASQPAQDQSPTPTQTATATPTSQPVSITITRISSQGKGQALLEWHDEGDLSKGLIVLWSKTKANPTYPEDTSTPINDSSAHKVVVLGDEGQNYFYRVCQFDGEHCSVYSNSYAYTFEGEPLGTPSANKIVITNISNQSLGRALVSWNAVGEFPNGFKIAWSATSAYPVYPGDNSVGLSDGSARSDVVAGEPGILYYFRVCDFNGIGCNSYSQTMPFRFSSEPTPVGGLINIISISHTSPGKALIKWNAEGSFPLGFEVVWSDSNPDPVFPDDNNIYLNDSGARSAEVSGTEGKTTYFRICRYTGTGCDVYSQNVVFTFGNLTNPVNPPVNGQISILGIQNNENGKAVITWNASGSFPNGFIVVWSDTNTNPVFPGSDNVYLSDPGARSAQVFGIPGKTYNFRVCRNTGTSCDIYSSSYKFTFTGVVQPIRSSIP